MSLVQWNMSRFYPSSTNPIEGYEALVVLNYLLPDNLSAYWKTKGLKICADGGAYRLMKRNEGLIPDAIQGDFDSVPQSVLDYYKSKNVTISKQTDQDTTDLQKCLSYLEQAEATSNKHHSTIIILGGLGGCLSHTFANLNVLYTYRHRKVVLVGRKNLAVLVDAGEETVLTFDHYRSSGEAGELFCSLVPLGVERARNISTTGLKWNLVGQDMAFGELISTSNQVQSDTITIKTDNHPLLWINDFAHQSSEE